MEVAKVNAGDFERLMEILLDELSLHVDDPDDLAYLPALNAARRLAPARPTIPTIRGALLKVEGGQLFVTATDLTAAITLNVPASLDAMIEHVSAVAPPEFSELIGKLPDGAISLSFQGKRIIIRSGGRQAEFATMPAEDYPPVPTTEGERVEFTADDFRRGVDSVSFAAAASDEPRDILKGVQVIADQGRAVFAAADGFRIAERIVPCGIGQAEAVVPAAALRFIASLLDDDGAISVTFGQTLALFSWDGVTVTVQLLRGSFPNYLSLIPTEFVGMGEAVIAMPEAHYIDRDGRRLVIVRCPVHGPKWSPRGDE